MRPLQRYLITSQRRRGSSGVSARVRQAGFGCGALLAVLLVSAILGGASLYVGLTANLPALDRLPGLLNPVSGALSQPTRLYDRSGTRLIYTLENEGIPRRSLPLDPLRPDHLSPLLAQTLISAKDPTFWQHPGFTWRSLAAYAPSTLAERLADRFLLAGEAPGWRRAFRMHLLAAQITAQFGRAQVLEWYLNSAYYGHHTFGTDSAARLYFGKSASDLSLGEAVLLLAAEDAPALNPSDAPAAAIERQQALLDRLLGSGVINEQDFLKARTSPPALRPWKEPPAQPAASFVHLALAELSERFGQDQLEQGGLRIITSLDYDLQLQVECAARAQLLRLQNKPSGITPAGSQGCAAASLLPTLPPLDRALPEGLQAGAVVLDLQKGEVLAYAGSLTTTGPAALQPAYQPGSLLTPFVALAGFARTTGPATLVWDIPASLPDELRETLAANTTFHGPVRLRQALANDYLAPFAQMLAQVGPQNVWQLAEPLGLRGLGGSQNQKPGELIYGGGSASLLDLAQAYATLANLGVQVGDPGKTPGTTVRPALLLSVQDGDGQVLLAGSSGASVTVLTPQLAFLLHDVLRDEAARRASLGSPNPLEIGRPSAGKLGRTADNRQVWTAGYTPQRLALTWLGLPEGQDGTLEVKMAAGLWHALIRAASQNLPAVDWREPPGISHMQVCDPSGLRPTSACPNLVSEIFLNGSEPVEADTLYRAVQINRETGRLATVFTSPALVDEKVFLIPPPEAKAWAEAAGLAQPPETYDAIQAPLNPPGVRLASPQPFAYVRGEVALRGTAAGEGFASYRIQVGPGLNPRSWQQIGEEGAAPVEDGLLGTWDTRGLDGLYAIRLQVVRAENRVDTAILQVTVDNTPPTARVSYPAPQDVVGAAGSAVTLQAELDDNISVNRAEWYIDGRLVGSLGAASLTPGQKSGIPWQPAPGVHTLTIKVYDAAGNEGNSAPVTFEVR